MNHSQAIGDQVFPFLPVVLILIVVLIVNLAVTKYHKSAIADAVRDLGAVPLAITWWPTLFIGPRARHYKARMQFPSGEIVTAICHCSFFAGVYWRDTPWLSRSQASTLPQTTLHCRTCGQPLQTDWKCCPKCGNPVA